MHEKIQKISSNTSEIDRFDSMEHACQKRLMSVVRISQMINQNTRIIIFILFLLNTPGLD